MAFGDKDLDLAFEIRINFVAPRRLTEHIVNQLASNSRPCTPVDRRPHV